MRRTPPCWRATPRRSKSTSMPSGWVGGFQGFRPASAWLRVHGRVGRLHGGVDWLGHAPGPHAGGASYPPHPTPRTQNATKAALEDDDGGDDVRRRARRLKASGGAKGGTAGKQQQQQLGGKLWLEGTPTYLDTASAACRAKAVFPNVSARRHPPSGLPPPFRIIACPELKCPDRSAHPATLALPPRPACVPQRECSLRCAPPSRLPGLSTLRYPVFPVSCPPRPAPLALPPSSSLLSSLHVLSSSFLSSYSSRLKKTAAAS
jgi:hypothetical protein